MTFVSALVELGGVTAARLEDGDALSAVVVAAAGAIGIAAGAPPVVRRAPIGLAIGLICAEGHIVLHTVPAEGRCIVDILAHDPTPVTKGVEVIARRLGATAAVPIGH